MVASGMIISFYRVMEKRGKAVEDVVKICYEVSEDFIARFPRFLLKFCGRLAFSSWFVNMFKSQAARSRKREFAKDFVYEIVEGTGEDFDWGFEFSECAVNKFYDAQGIEKLKPYCNFFDVTYSRLMDMGLVADNTIGLGCDRCRLLYKKGGKTKIPEKLKGIIS